MNYRALKRFSESARRSGAQDQFLTDLGVNTVHEYGTNLPGPPIPDTPLADRHERHRLSLKEIFCAVVEDGLELLQNFDPKRSGSFNLTKLVEDGAVDSSAFTSISGQIVFNELLDAFENEDFVFARVIPTMSTSFRGEMIAGITGIGDKAAIVGEGKDYPRVGVSEDWIRTPVTVKRGHIIELTREAVFFDRTGQLLEMANQTGLYLGINKEKRLIDMVIDENSTAHRYNFRDTVIASFADDSGDHNWDNLEANNALVDWKQIDVADQLLNAILDPNTAEPIVLSARHLVCARGLFYTAERIRTATRTQFVTPGYATTSDPTVTEVDGGPFSNDFDVVTSRQLAVQLGTDTSWFWGDLSALGRYAENWGLTTVPQPPNSQREFENDVINAWKSSEMGAAFVKQPRVVVKSTA